MKNIHVLPTDKQSRVSDCHDNKLHLDDTRYLRKYQNIYITSNEKIKVSDWFIHYSHGTTSLLKAIEVENRILDNQGTSCNIDYCKKIILTNDSTLIEDGVQAIDDEFLEWFVKNPSCEEVETKLVEQRSHLTLNDWVDKDENERFPVSIAGAFCYRKIYKIIIPKEETKHYLDKSIFKNVSRLVNLNSQEEPKPIHQQIIDTVGGEDRFKEIAGLKPKQENDINTCRYFDIEVGCEREKCICENIPKEKTKKIFDLPIATNLRNALTETMKSVSQHEGGIKQGEINLPNFKEEVIKTEEDAKIFVETMENIPEPNDKLKKAFRDFSKQETLEKYSERFDNKENEVVDGIFNPENWGKRIVKQETLEEAAERLWLDSTSNLTSKKSFIAGAKWQQEKSYNELFEWLASKDYLSDKVDVIQKEFKQFKNK